LPDAKKNKIIVYISANFAAIPSISLTMSDDVVRKDLLGVIIAFFVKNILQ